MDKHSMGSGTPSKPKNFLAGKKDYNSNTAQAINTESTSAKTPWKLV
jgi:hypothetical protein